MTLFELTIQEDELPQKFTTSIEKKNITFIAPKTNSEYIYFGDFCVRYIPGGDGIGYRLSPFWGVLNDAPNYQKIYMHNSQYWYVSGRKGDKLIGWIEDDPVHLVVKKINDITGNTLDFNRADS